MKQGKATPVKQPSAKPYMNSVVPSTTITMFEDDSWLSETLCQRPTSNGSKSRQTSQQNQGQTSTMMDETSETKSLVLTSPKNKHFTTWSEQVAAQSRYVKKCIPTSYPTWSKKEASFHTPSMMTCGNPGFTFQFVSKKPKTI